MLDEKDVLKSIATNFAERKSSAALNNYEVLYNNIKYVNNLLLDYTYNLKDLNIEIENSLDDSELVLEGYSDKANSKFFLKKIIPRILRNDLEIIKKFLILAEGDDRRGIDVNNVTKLKKEFIDYNDLVTTTRQILDSLVSDSYQLVMLDVKELNFHVLTSLKSFDLYATKSIRQSLFNDEIKDALIEFDNLNYNQRVGGKKSNITKCSKKSFGQKIDFLFDELNLITEQDFKEDLKNLFRFSSEFTHIGYISTFFTSSEGADVVFGSDIGPYLLSTENFNELKYEILETMTKLLSKIYLPSVVKMLEEVFVKNYAEKLSDQIENYINIFNSFLGTRNNEYYFFILEGLIGSDETIDLECMCGGVNYWEPPHDLSQIYCKGCGSSFQLIELSGDPGYIFTSMGPVKVIGSSVPDIDELTAEEKEELYTQYLEVLDMNKDKN